MARFALTLKDTARHNATVATRYPQRSGFIQAASWSGAINVDVSVRDGIDWCVIRFASHHGRGRNKIIYEGPMSGEVAHVQGVRLVTGAGLVDGRD